MKNYLNKIEETKNYLFKKINTTPKIAIILGSGLGSLTSKMTNQIVIPYKEIPNFLSSELVGHSNELVIGTLNDKEVIAMKGRFHYYEGYSLKEITFPIRVFKELGIQYLIITNSCGAINETFKPGELMLIKDHLNLVGTNPLIGENIESLGTRFPDLSNAYNKDLRDLVKRAALKENIKLNEGVYAWWSGPAYETPAEIKMIRTLGADAVGMSTVPEVIVANHAGLKTIGISTLTNMASGILKKPLSHKEVVEVANSVKEKFAKLIMEVIKEIN